MGNQSHNIWNGIFWSSRTNCADEPSLEIVPDQKYVRQTQTLLENTFEERIEKFEQFAKLSLSQWETKVSSRLYPLNIRIEMETPILCAGAGQYDLIVYAGEGKPDIIIPNQLILESGGKLKSAEESAGFISLKMHELGHLIARSIGYPIFKSETYQGPLEEVIADFVGFIGNQNNPLIGEGLSADIDAEYCSKLSGQLEPIERAKNEGICQVHSADAMRDLRLPLQYQNLFKFPEVHFIAGHTNALLYRVGNIVGIDVLFKNFMTEFFSMSSSTFDVEIYIFVDNIIKRILVEKPEKHESVLQIMKKLNWKPSESSQHHVEVKKPMQTQKLVQVEISPEVSLVNDVFEFPFVNLNLKWKGQTLFSYTSMGDFWKPKATLTKESSCSSNEHDCKCFQSGEILTVDAVYLNKQEKVLRTSVQNVLTFGHDVQAGCFRFGAE